MLDPTDIVDLREGRPVVRRVRDLGNVHIGAAGPLLAESDGQFNIGEFVLIEGSGFGKQPTVTLGGRPAELLWRTEGGGIVLRLPAGAAAGPQPLVVHNGDGTSQLTLVVRRLGLILAAGHGQLHVVEVGGGPGIPAGVRPVGQPVALPGGKRMALSADGAVAYVLMSGGEHDRVAIVDLLAPFGPKVFDTQELTHRAGSVVAAERAGTVAFVGGEFITVWDAREPRRPAPWRAAPLPPGVRGRKGTLGRAALDPTGTLLALAEPEGNRVQLLDVKPGLKEVRPRLLAQVEALPQSRQPALVDLRFSSDGETLWLLAGDNAQSDPAGHQPTRMVALHLGAAEADATGTPRRELTVLRTLDLPDAGAPIRLALGRAAPVASGAALRTPPEQAALYFTAAAPGLLAGKAAGGSLLHVDPQRGADSLYAGDDLLGGVDLTPDAAVALCASLAPGAQGLGATVVQIENHATVTLPLGGTSPDDLRSPAAATDVAVQP